MLKCSKVMSYLLTSRICMVDRSVVSPIYNTEGRSSLAKSGKTKTKSAREVLPPGAASARSLGNLKPPWKPGQSGNPKGRPKSKSFKGALNKAIDEADGDKSLLELIAKSLINQALAGDVRAIKEIANRLDGKVGPAVVDDVEDEPVSEVRWVVVHESLDAGV